MCFSYCGQKLLWPNELRFNPANYNEINFTRLSGKNQCLLWLLWKGSGPPLKHSHIVSRYFFLHHLRHTILKKSAVLKLKRDLSIWWMNSNPWINIMAVFAVTYKTGSFQVPENLPSALQLQISCFYVFFFFVLISLASCIWEKGIKAVWSPNELPVPCSSEEGVGGRRILPSMAHTGTCRLSMIGHS